MNLNITIHSITKQSNLTEVLRPKQGPTQSYFGGCKFSKSHALQLIQIITKFSSFPKIQHDGENSDLKKKNLKSMGRKRSFGKPFKCYHLNRSNKLVRIYKKALNEQKHQEKIVIKPSHSFPVNEVEQKREQTIPSSTHVNKKFQKLMWKQNKADIQRAREQERNKKMQKMYAALN